MAQTPKEVFAEYREAYLAKDERRTKPLLDRIIRENTPLVHMMVRRFVSQWHVIIPKEDLTQAGIMGMVRALTTYDPARAKFSTWAGEWIRYYLQELARSEGYDLKRNVPAAVMRAIREFHDRTGVWPEPDDLPQCDPKQFRKAMMPAPKLVPYTEPGDKDTLTHAWEDLGRDDDRSRAASSELDPEMALGLKRGLAALPKRCAAVLSLHTEGMTSKQIARELNILEIAVLDEIDRARKVLKLHLPT